MKRKIASLVVAVVMTVGILTGYTSVSGNAAEASNNTFTGIAPGFLSPIEVQITVEDDVIVEIEYLQFGDTLNLVDVAMYRILYQIIEHQSLGVDIVTGVTVTSLGIVQAVANAAEEAGLDVAALRAAPVNITPRPDIVQDIDILVMGGGGAGFAAAITAAQEGASVVLIEKASVLGGNTLKQGGAYNAVNFATQAGMTLTVAQYDTLNSYLAMTPQDPELMFNQFPEWATVLEELQDEIRGHFATHAGTTAGEDMPGFDSYNLHMFHMYIGGLRQMLDGTYIASDLELARVMVTYGHDALEWIYHVGGAFANYQQETLSTVLGAMWPRTHSFANGRNLMDPLRDTALELGVEILMDTRGTELIADEEGRVVGALAIDMVDGTNLIFNTAQGVILATGGFGDYPALAVQYDNYWGPNLSPNTLSTNSGTLRGDGIIMARDIGAALTADMGTLQMMPSSSPTKGTLTDGLWASADTQLWVDRYGNRFVDEYAERDVLAIESMALEGGVFFIVFAGGWQEVEDMPVARAHRGVAPYGPGNFGSRIEELIEREYIWWGSTVAELAEATQAHAAKNVVPAFTYESLRATIERYNQIVIDQYDPDFGKGVIGGFIDLEYIENNPEVGIAISPRRASIHHTMGGVQIDTETRVINTDGYAIPGLWAAGEVTGGIHAGNRLGGNAVTDVFVFGRIAGYNAANE